MIPEGVRFLAPHVAVIGRCTPDPEVPTIEDGIQKIINSLGLRGRDWAEIRGPRNNLLVHDKFYKDQAAIARMEVINGWHHDTASDFSAMVLWASSEPTQFLLPNGEIVQAEPFDVVLADNDAVQHRVPPVIGRDRWFYRKMAQIPEWL